MDGEINYATNWAIEGGGSLVNSVTVESSFSSIAESVDDDNGNALVSVPEYPLMLRPPSPNSGPCEITIRFSQRHEVQQVYVRSTARVYEIYYTTGLQRSNEYLCTARCGISTGDGEELHTTGVQEASLAHPQPVKDPAMRSKNEGAVNTNEDDWVEVTPPVLDLGSSPLPSSFDGDRPGGSVQDFYAATAEIDDADPCISITLRLLSLQDKGCLLLDEVYVFADPVDPADSENDAGQVENMAGSSVMAMLVPTLLQLSKTRDVKRIQDEQASGVIENQKTKESGLKANKSTQVADKMYEEGKSRMAADDLLEENIQEAAASTVQTPQFESQVSGAESKPYLSCSHADSLLGQLVSRISRIEDLFLRFEEQMLKPISSIDERLQHVEQTLEKFVEKFQNSGLPSCTRIIAPEFSCHESDHNSSYTNGNNNSNCGSSEINEEDSLDVTGNDMVNSTSVGQSVPGLVVTAPEFVNIDDEEDYFPVRNSPKDEVKHSVSIDDALASALSGFLSSTLIEGQRRTEAFAAKVDEFSNEDTDNKKAPPNTECGENTDLLSCSDALKGTDCINGSLDNSSCISCIEDEGIVMKSLDYLSGRTRDGIPNQCQHKVVAEDASEYAVADSQVASAGHDLEDTDSNQFRENTGSVEPDIQSQCVGNLIDNDPNSTQGGVASLEFSSTEKDLKEFYDDVLQDVLKFSHGTCLDFEAPILDVKFNSLGGSNCKSSIVALFNELPESNIESPAVRGSVDGFDNCNLISVGDGVLTGPPTNTLCDANIDYCNADYIPLSLEGEKPHDDYACNTREMPATSLI